MALESAPQDGRENVDAAGCDVESMRQHFRTLVMGSRLNREEQQSALGWLEESQESRDASQLQIRISHLPVAEQASRKLVDAYAKKIEDAMHAGTFSKNSSRKQAYMDWFEKLSYADKQKYLKESDLDKPERKAVLEAFKRLPSAVRKDLQQEFGDGGLEERQKMVGKASKKHEELKLAFLKLPPEIQEKYREQFKVSTLQERERLLKSIGVTGLKKDAESKNKSPEDAENQQLIKEYDEKMIGLIEKNLFSPLSMKAYQEWFRALPLSEKRKNLRKSDLNDTDKLRERVTVRDTFMALNPAIQKKNELRFRNADLEGRKAILASMNQTVSKGFTSSYPENIMKHTLEQAMESPALAQTRMLYTEMKEVATLRRRAEIRFESKKADGIVQKAANDDREVDPTNVMFIEDFRHHQEKRFGLKRHLIQKRAEGKDAMETGAVLVNRQKQEVNAETFGHLIVDHLKGEFVAGIVNAAAQRLPRANRAELSKVAEKLDPTVDLYKTVA
ncbi:hypothetical protein HZA42_03520 [Candidatus Peregrinibacteria bacterium]|nr:hypothetical protein [Candidatus Peregrinibacteria bacterium]